MKITLKIAAILGTLPAVALAAWTPPFGIPAPAFGINETAPVVPSPWTVSTPGYYYVNNISGCSDSGNGFPTKPRCSVPLNIPAGAVVEIHGTYPNVQTSPNIIRPAGTAANPVYIRGVAGSEPNITGQWEVEGAYAILENLHWNLVNFVDKNAVGFYGDHMVFRFNDVHGNPNAGQVAVGGSNVVLYKNYIHDGGDVNAAFDQDIHCIQMSAPSASMWIVDNEMARCSGDGMQVNGSASDTIPATSQLHHVYVGRNNSHHNKQTGFWTKYASDVIISQNALHDHHPSASSANGACTGYQYGPSHVWFLFNDIYNCDTGIMGAGNGGPSGNGAAQNVYMVGNVIRSIHDSAGLNTAPDAWKNGGAVYVTDGDSPKYIFNNTIYDVDGGIQNPRSGDTVSMVNNILRSVRTQHVIMQSATNVTLAYSIFDSPRNLVGITCSSGCQDVDPQFVNASGGDFHLTAGSPAIDKGVDLSVLATAYQNAYGVSLAFDLAGSARPQGAGFDIGAYEFGAGAPPPPSSACDLNGDNVTNINDIQMTVVQAIGAAPCTNADINQDGSCNVIDVQRVVNVVLGGACVSP